MANIKKIKLSNNQIYSIFDEGALRLDEVTHKLITGNAVVDQVLLDGDLYIAEVDDIPVDPTNVLVWEEATGQVCKRSTNLLLADIGGISYGMNENTGVLSLKYGKQEQGGEG